MELRTGTRVARAVRSVAAVGLLVAGGGCAPVVPSAPPSSGASTNATQRPTNTAPSPTQTQAIVADDVGLTVIVEGLSTPVGLVAAPDGSGRSFVLEQTGRIHVLESGALRPQPFLDLSKRLVRLSPDYDERGLLGLAFHPSFATNGRLFVYYSAPRRRGAPATQDHTNTLSEFRVLAADPNRADPASERKILEFEQPQPNHSGGALGFGPDGYLYLGAGDGGGTGDASPGHSPQGNAQDTSKLNGKVMRIDVDGKQPYAVPRDNPFARGGGRPEIYAYGFRNPWRLSWELAGQRRLLVSDVGYGRYEEIDAVTKGGNYGWRIREGRHCLDLHSPLQPLATCATKDARSQPLVDPVVEYSHQQIGTAIVGGYRYRGTAIPSLREQYVFADFSAEWTGDVPRPSASLLAARPEEAPGAEWDWRQLTVANDNLDFFITGMGEDAGGELYVMARTSLGPTGTTGKVLQLVPPAP
jgi:glucose/arabinose dehydrogenase